MDKVKRGQSGLEFMIVLSLVMVVFMIVGYIIYRDYVKSNDLKIYISGVRLANHIADQISAINAVQDGHSTKLILPRSVYGGINYTVNFYKNESAVFIEGSGFSSGSGVRYSSPISTSDVNCLLPECANICNVTDREQCLQVTHQMEVRLVKDTGGVFMTQDYNVLQDGVSAYVAPFDFPGKPDLANPPGFVRRGGDVWNVMYVHHNTVNDTYSLVVSLNISNAPPLAELDMQQVVGEVEDIRSKDAGEFSYVIGPQQYRGVWTGTSPPSVHGGSLEFRRGFRICAQWVGGRIPAPPWKMMSYDGADVALDNTKQACVAYP
jgi:hypothetical protein